MDEQEHRLRVFTLAQLAGLSDGDAVNVGDDVFVYVRNSTAEVDPPLVCLPVSAPGRFLLLQDQLEGVRQRRDPLPPRRSGGTIPPCAR